MSSWFMGTQVNGVVITVNTAHPKNWPIHWPQAFDFTISPPCKYFRYNFHIVSNVAEQTNPSRGKIKRFAFLCSYWFHHALCLLTSLFAMLLPFTMCVAWNNNKQDGKDSCMFWAFTRSFSTKARNAETEKKKFIEKCLLE